MKKKAMSFVLAMAMILSALPAAAAVSADPLSEYAGKTMTVRVTHVHGDGKVTQDIIDVDIPEGTSQKAETDLIYATATAANNSAVRRVAASGIVGDKGEQITAKSPVSLNTSYSTIGDPVTLGRSYSSIVFSFNSGTCTGNPSIVYIKLKYGASDGVTASESIEHYIGGSGEDMISSSIVIVDKKTYGGGTTNFVRGDSFEMSCKVNRGTARFAGLVLTGYYY